MAFSIIQGGMGVGVSGWQLARAVSTCGQLGVVSGTGLPVVLARRLQGGDPGGHMRRALGRFPVPAMAEKILKRYFLAGGKSADAAFTSVALPQFESSRALLELTVVANFAEVFLAKEGHDGLVGVNYLEKVQIPTLPSILGAMLAGVDYILMGAGIPRQIPGVLDALAAGQTATLRLDVKDAGADERFACRLDPADLLGFVPALKRPRFLAIVASAVLAITLARKSNGTVDGFIIEGPTAGGHNAPPRGPLTLTIDGQPVYGQRDEVDLAKIRELGLPFWLAGGFADPQRLREAMAAGAAGVQVGTAFAFCEESGIAPALKAQALALCREDTTRVFTDPLASPTGFPFKVVPLAGTLAEAELYDRRERVCDLGFLREAYRRADGSLGYRCAAEPVEDYLAKGGAAADTQGRKCLCNALFGTIGLGQVRADGRREGAVVTAGDDFAGLSRLLAGGKTSYAAKDVIAHILGA